jgi:phthalate 4,5-dioxygenase oxygenase subunit
MAQSNGHATSEGEYSQNDFLCRVGPKTPMGAALRRYWWPIGTLADFPVPDSDPKHVRLLGSDFVAFRDTEGVVGLLDEACCHRGSSLTLGRVEDCGIRCLYHGWKFGVDGKLQDTPNMPDGRFKERVRQQSYSVREAGGLIWGYIGPEDKVPPFPHYAFMDEGTPGSKAVRYLIDCNYVQVMDGNLDTSHAFVLHTDLVNRWSRDASNEGALAKNFNPSQTVPRLEFAMTDFGFYYAGIRSGGGVPEGKQHMRITALVLPHMALIPGETGRPLMWAPIDDEHTWLYLPNVDAHAVRLANLTFPADLVDASSHVNLNRANNFGQDREIMRSGSFTGLRTTLTEDAAMQISMGSLYDHDRETVVPADRAVLKARRLLVESARRVQAGEEPLGVRPADTQSIRAVEALADDSTPWQHFVDYDNLLSDDEQTDDEKLVCRD